MNEKTLSIETPDGSMETFIAHPDGAGPFPVVVLYMDAPGIREELYDFVRRIAAQGYYAMVPDLYYSRGRIRRRSFFRVPEESPAGLVSKGAGGR